MKKELVKGFEIYEAEDFEFDGYRFAAFKIGDGPENGNYIPNFAEDTIEELIKSMPQK